MRPGDSVFYVIRNLESKIDRLRAQHRKMQRAARMFNTLNRWSDGKPVLITAKEGCIEACPNCCRVSHDGECRP